MASRGNIPSVAAVAEAAEVSRRTVYMYFPTLEHLFLDATLGSLASTAAIGAAIDEHGSDEKIEARVERLARLMQRGAAETEQQGRTPLRLTAWAARALVKATLDEAERDASRRRAAKKRRTPHGRS